MNFLTTTILFLTVTVVFTADEVRAIKCYQCNSHFEGQKDCVDLLNRNTTSMAFLKTCIRSNDFYNSTQFCRKTVITVYHSGPHERRTYRGCGWVKDDTKDCYRVANNDHMEYSCQCFEDGCNSALQVTISKMNTVVVLLLGMILSYFYM